LAGDASTGATSEIIETSHRVAVPPPADEHEALSQAAAELAEMTRQYDAFVSGERGESQEETSDTSTSEARSEKTERADGKAAATERTEDRRAAPKAETGKTKADTSAAETGKTKEGAQAQRSEGEPDEAQAAFWDLVRTGKIDADKLIKEHPRLTHRLGALVDKSAKEQLEARARELDDKQRELDGLKEQIRRAQDSPVEFIDEFVKQAESKLTESERAEAERQAQTAREQAEAAQLQHLYGQLSEKAGEVLAAFQKQLPVTAQQKLQGKAYEGYWHEAFADYLEDAVTAAVDERFSTKAEAEVEKRLAARLKTAEAEWTKKRLPALSRDARAVEMEEEPSTDVDGGTAIARRRFTREAIEKMSPDEYEAHKEEIWASLGM